MIIRRANTNDLEIIYNIEEASYPSGEGASKEDIKSRLQHFSNYFWILEDNDEILAFVNGMITNENDLIDEMYHHPEMHNENGDWFMIFSVVTSPNHRHKGYADRVMNRVITDIKLARKKGLVLACKENLIPFYSRFGFITEGLSQSCNGGAVWYQMRLTF